MIRKKESIYRIIDANLNRTIEGLRVCEEVVRFILNSQNKALGLKKIRHELVQVAKDFPLKYEDLLKGRESRKDVGKTLVVHAQKDKCVKDVFVSNIKRSQEALRVLEEFSKLIDKSKSASFQSIRFKLYQIEKKVILDL